MVVATHPKLLGGVPVKKPSGKLSTTDTSALCCNCLSACCAQDSNSNIIDKTADPSQNLFNHFRAPVNKSRRVKDFFYSRLKYCDKFYNKTKISKKFYDNTKLLKHSLYSLSYIFKMLPLLKSKLFIIGTILWIFLLKPATSVHGDPSQYIYNGIPVNPNPNPIAFMTIPITSAVPEPVEQANNDLDNDSDREEVLPTPLQRQQSNEYPNNLSSILQQQQMNQGSNETSVVRDEEFESEANTDVKQPGVCLEEVYSSTSGIGLEGDYHSDNVCMVNETRMSQRESIIGQPQSHSDLGTMETSQEQRRSVNIECQWNEESFNFRQDASTPLQTVIHEVRRQIPGRFRSVVNLLPHATQYLFMVVGDRLTNTDEIPTASLFEPVTTNLLFRFELCRNRST